MAHITPAACSFVQEGYLLLLFSSAAFDDWSLMLHLPIAAPETDRPPAPRSAPGDAQPPAQIMPYPIPAPSQRPQGLGVPGGLGHAGGLWWPQGPPPCWDPSCTPRAAPHPLKPLQCPRGREKGRLLTLLPQTPHEGHVIRLRSPLRPLGVHFP